MTNKIEVELFPNRLGESMSLIEKQIEKSNVNIRRLAGGLNKLKSAKIQVAELQEILIDL